MNLDTCDMDIEFDVSQFDDMDNMDIELNPLEIGAIAVVGVTALNGVAVIASAAPAYVGVMSAAGAALGWCGFRKRQGLPIIPGQGDVEVAVTAKVTPSPVPAPQAGTVTNATGKTINPEDL
jgi:hypothetical protein